MKKQYWITGIILLAVLGAAIFLAVQGGLPATNPDTTTPAPSAQTTTEAPPVRTVKLMAVGDNLIHKPIYNQAKQRAGGNGYDFAYCYDGVRERIGQADLAVINQETILASDVASPSSYPMFCTPTQCGDAIYDLGFRAIGLANNHELDKGTKGVIASLDYWASKPGVVTCGSYRNEADFNTPHVLEINGVRFAFVGATYGYNGLQLPQGSDLILPLLEDEDLLQRAVEAGKQAADVVVAMMHWGTEDSQVVTDAQRQLAAKLVGWGTDIVLGTHPHVLQTMEYLDKPGGGQAFVAYSLGNFISGQTKAPNLIAGILELTVTVQGDAVSVTAPRFYPSITQYSAGYSNVHLIEWKNYTRALASSHGVRSKDSRFTYDYIESLLRKTIPEDYLVL